jgi:hypothetical protein
VLVRVEALATAFRAINAKDTAAQVDKRGAKKGQKQ